MQKLLYTTRPEVREADNRRKNQEVSKFLHLAYTLPILAALAAILRVLGIL